MIVQFIKKNSSLFFLFIIISSLIVANHSSGKFLSGWDTLHPEFNFNLSLNRVINGVWREEQGLGAVAGHSHMADLPRIALLYLISFITPFHLLRYLFFFLALILGPLGVYHFLEQAILKEKPVLFKKVAASFGGLFYLLNLGTLQHFYVPFEMFAALYAFIPWLFLFTTKYIAVGERKNLIWFGLITFLSTPIAYAATLWYVYFASLAIYCFTISLLRPRNFSKFNRLIGVLLTTLVINSYWLLPNIYFIATSAETIPQAKINQLFSEQAFLHDKEYATFNNVAFLKGFLFDWREYKGGEFVALLDEWQRHLQNSLVLWIGKTLFGFVLLGILMSIVKRKKISLSFLPIFFLSFAALLHSYPPFAQLFSFMRNHFSLFSEGLRFPWTKFSIILMFCYAFYFSQAIYEISNWLRQKKIVFAFWVIILIFNLVWMWPASSGNLISQSMRVGVPDEYFALFSWFITQPNSQRIAFFPVLTFRGWEHYNWGFEGAGFLWFGLKQPILVRDFDRWNPKNENFYWEINYALYSQNLQLFEKVLEKYQINWLLVDENVINPTSPKALYFDELEQILSASDKISLTQNFGKIKIYQVNLENPVKDFVFLAQNLPVIEPKYNWNNYDGIYLENGNYISPTENWELRTGNFSYYPFRTLFSGKTQEDLEFEVEDKEDYFLFKRALPETVKNYQLQIPEFIKEELMWVDPDNLSRFYYLSPEVYFNDSTIEVKVPKVGGYFAAEIDPATDPSVKEAKNCNQFSQGIVKNEIIEEDGEKVLRLISLDANNCGTSFWLPNLPHKNGYLITFESRHQAGKGLLFWLENLNIRKADIETYLPKEKKFITAYFIQPPMEEDGLGYTLHFDNISIGRDKTVNDIDRITINPIPFNFLTSLKLVPTQATNIDKEPKITLPIEVSHPNPSFYQVTLGPSDGSQTLVLSQSFHQGWQAFKVEGPSIKRIKDHVLVNNWANGWLLEAGESEKILLIFLPQLLEYLGFLLLLFSCPTAYFLLK